MVNDDAGVAGGGRKASPEALQHASPGKHAGYRLAGSVTRTDRVFRRDTGFDADGAGSAASGGGGSDGNRDSVRETLS